jgi:hypothetical protein
MTGYISLYIIFIIVSLSYAGIVSKRYTEKLVPYLWNDKTNWNPNVDRLKLLLSSTLFISPIILFKSFIKYNSSNIYFNYLGFSILIILLTFCFWFDLKKINHMKEVKIFNKKNDTGIEADEFKNNLEKIKVKQDKLESISIDIISKVDYSYNEVLNFKEETLDNLSDIEKDVLKIRKETKENKSSYTNNFKLINDEISKIKGNSKSKKRETLKRSENINRIESEFEILISDLNKFPHFDSNKKVILNKKYKITELQAYQILLLFFQNKYKFSPKNTNEIIYSLFNKYFGNLTEVKKGDITNMNKGNWKEYKNRKHLSNVKNEELYSQLNLYIKR